MEMTVNTITTRVRNAKKRMAVKRAIAKLIAICIGIAIAGTVVVDITNHIEYFDETSRYNMLLELNSNNQLAIDHYKKHYINDHIYLFNGDLTLKFMADQYSVSFDTLKLFYETSGVESLQEFHDTYLEDSEDLLQLSIAIYDKTKSMY